MRRVGRLAMILGVMTVVIAAVGLSIAIAQNKPTPKDPDNNGVLSHRLGL